MGVRYEVRGAKHQLYSNVLAPKRHMELDLRFYKTIMLPATFPPVANLVFGARNQLALPPVDYS